MWITLFQVALGGAIGSSLRFAVGVLLLRVSAAFPLAIISVNVLGSFLMGLFVVWSHQRGWTHLNPFVMTGVLGGFTTFSAFSLEAYTLFERGQVATAAVYVAASVVFSLLGLTAGVLLARGALA